MKLILLVNKFILTIFLIVFVQVAFAKQYEIPELYLTINIPDEYYVITNKTNNGKVFKELDIDKEEIFKYMKDNDICLWVVDRNFKFDIVVSGVGNNEALQKMGDSKNYPSLWKDPSYQDNFKKVQRNKYNHDIKAFNDYQTDNALYYVSNGTANKNGEIWFVKNYQTIKNGMLISVFSSGIFSEKNIAESRLLSIVDSIQFTKSNNYSKPNSVFERALSRGLVGGVSAGVIVGIILFIRFIWSKIKHKAE